MNATKPEWKSNEILRDSFTDFLNRDTFDWSVFGTFTFRRARKRRAIDSLSHLLGSLNRTTGGYGYAFICEEIGHSGGRRHLHALIECPEGAVFDIGRRWERSDGGGWCSVRRFVPSRGAQSYVTKYMIKDAQHLGDWDLVTIAEKEPDLLWSDNGLTTDKARLYSETVALTNRSRAD